MAMTDETCRTVAAETDRAREERVRRRRRIRQLERLAAPALVIAVLVIWELYVQLSGISKFILPPISDILVRLVEERALLLSHGVTTALEVIGGFAIAVLAGIGIALAIFYSRLVEVSVYPVLVALQTVPKVALAPLIVIYFGYGWGPKLFLAFLISFFAILVATVVGLQGLDKGYADVARSMGASERQIFLKIRLPAALPNIFGGLKVGLTLAVIGAIIGEYVASERGLGYLQLQANSNFDTTLNFAIIIAIAILGVSLYGLLRLAEVLMIPRRKPSR